MAKSNQKPENRRAQMIVCVGQSVMTQNGTWKGREQDGQYNQRINRIRNVLKP